MPYDFLLIGSNGEEAFYVGWGTLSLINAGLAQSKGRRGLIWFLLSWVLGPVATLLIVILHSQDSAHGSH